MAALLAASASRSEHELAVHGYQHVTLGEQRTYSPYGASKKRPDPA